MYRSFVTKDQSCSTCSIFVNAFVFNFLSNSLFSKNDMNKKWDWNTILDVIQIENCLEIFAKHITYQFIKMLQLQLISIKNKTIFIHTKKNNTFFFRRLEMPKSGMELTNWSQSKWIDQIKYSKALSFPRNQLRASKNENENETYTL